MSVLAPAKVTVCPCGQHIDHEEHVHLESDVTGGRYCDIVCLVRGTGARWIGCTIIDEYGDTYTEAKYMKVMGVRSHG